MRGNHKHSFKDVRLRKNLMLKNAGLLLKTVTGE